MSSHPLAYPAVVKVALVAAVAVLFQASFARAEFKAGAAVVDVTPVKFPVLVNGSMLTRSLDRVNTRVFARAIVLADDKTQIAIVVVDSCMMGRPLLDEAKSLASARTGIPTARMLISATHAHSAPASMGCLGTDADENYVPFLRDKLVEAIATAKANLEPARIGFAKGNAAEFTAVRQWIRRPDRIEVDPFGNRTVRANMHAGRKWEDATGEAGPEDPDLSLVSIQSRDGRPLAVLGNFSMHYFGDKDISADYFGLFCTGLEQRIASESKPGKPAFVGLMSHGCSGDIWRRDYTRPESEWNAKLTIDEYSQGLLGIAMKVYDRIEYRHDVDVSMAERRMTLNYRVPNKQMLEWAQRTVAEMGDRPAKSNTEVYAKEQIILHERQQTEIVVQALKVGDIGIATTPCETYAITGLKIKAASPLKHNIVIELANGGDGYIPPAEQHAFGGYNTWPARSAGLEVMAEPKITEAAIAMLEQLAGKPRRDTRLSDGKAAKTVLALKPIAYWRLNEFTGPHALDSSDNRREAVYEPAITYYLEGASSSAFCEKDEVNRAPHLVGGRLRAQLGELGDRYSISLWFWNGMPNDGRDTSGWLVSRDHDHGLTSRGVHLGIGGKTAHTGKLIFLRGIDASTTVAGKTEIPRWQWQQLTLVRDGATVRVFLNGKLEIETKLTGNGTSAIESIFFGGRSDNDSNWEGRLDEIAVFNRPLTADEIAKLKAE